MKKIFVSLTLVLALLFSVVGCGKKEKNQEFNFFRYAVDVQGEDFSPKGLTFLMTLDSFLEAKGLDRSQVTPGQRESLDYVMLKDVKYEGIDASVSEIYGFQEEMLYGVSYTFLVEEDAAKNLYSQLYEMAKEHLPSPRPGYTWEDISKRCRAMWDSPDGDLMQLNTYAMEDGTMRIGFGISVSDKELGKHIEKRPLA